MSVEHREDYAVAMKISLKLHTCTMWVVSNTGLWKEQLLDPGVNLVGLRMWCIFRQWALTFREKVIFWPVGTSLWREVGLLGNIRYWCKSGGSRMCLPSTIGSLWRKEGSISYLCKFGWSIFGCFTRRSCDGEGNFPHRRALWTVMCLKLTTIPI